MRGFMQLDRFLVPAERAAVTRFFADGLLVAHGRRERLEAFLLRISPPGFRTRLLERKSEREGATADHRRSDQAVVEWALRQLSSWDETPVEPDPTCWLGLRDYPDRSRRGWVVFLFGTGDDRPCAILKLRLSSGGARSLGSEFEALHAVRARLPKRLRETVPEPFAYRETHGRELLLLSALPGRPAYVETHSRLIPRRRVSDHFRHAGTWLADFHLATSGNGGGWEGFGAVIERSMPAVAARVSESLVEDLAEEAARRLPSVPSHGDFWSRNLLLGRGGEAVVDWERFSPAAPPYRDLFHFPLSYGLDYPWSGYGRSHPGPAFRRTFLETNHLSRQVRLYFDRYCERTGLEHGALRPLIRLHLLERYAESTDETWIRAHDAMTEARWTIFDPWS